MTEVRRRRRGGRGERPMVPDAEFTSYYGRPIVKAVPWEADIPAYLFLGGLAAGSAVLGAGADLTRRVQLRRVGRLGALGAIGLSFAALVHDLGKPSRFFNMLRVFKPTSPMSMGTWVLSLFGPAAGIAGVAELRGWLPRPLARLLGATARPAGLAAAATAPAVATYTAVLLADTATPSWHEAYRELPFVFAGSAASAAGGLGLIGAPVGEAGPARRMAVGGGLLELAAEQRMVASMGLAAEPLHQGRAGMFMRASKALTIAGTVGAALGRRNRAVSVAAGAALLVGSALTRFGIFEAGRQSADDPKYTVVPQRERIRARDE
jgi:formate-dependent nitrite reductase membrane component NrfD